MRMSCLAYDDMVQHVPAAAAFATNSGLGARQSAKLPDSSSASFVDLFECAT